LQNKDWILRQIKSNSISKPLEGVSSASAEVMEAPAQPLRAQIDPPVLTVLNHWFYVELIPIMLKCSEVSRSI
jgi:hypothetical protein